MVAKDVSFKFISAPDYLATVGDSYKRENGALDQSAVYRTCELLVLDDIGTQMSKEWHSQEMFRLIDERMRQGKVTIYTSNLPFSRLNVDDRIKSRISSTSVTIQMPEESVREQQATENRQDFLNRVLGKAE